MNWFVLCSWGQHIVLLFDGQRNEICNSLPLECTTKIEGDNWIGCAFIPSQYLPHNVSLMNAYAIHGSGSKRVYQSLSPVPKGQFQSPDL